MISYFAYGSNLDFVQMRGPMPDHSIRMPGGPEGPYPGLYELFPESQLWRRRRHPRKGHDAWGVVYQFQDQDLAALDEAEGYQPGRAAEQNAYNRDDAVRVFAENDERQPMTVSAYIAVKQESTHLPSEAYMRQVIDGAKFWKLPPPYVEELLRILLLPAPGDKRSS